MLSSNAPVGRPDPIPTALTHFVNGQNLHTPPQNGLEQAMFGMGCFWGVERIFWQTQGVHVTAVGYSGGQTPNPTYQEVCTGQTAHNEVVWLTYDPKIIPYSALLRVFWQGHNPTQGMRQGNDRGTQYRSGIYTYSPAQETEAKTSKTMYQKELNAAQHGMITTEILPAEPFYYAEDYHQQYLAKNPAGYCGIGGLGVACPLPAQV